MTDKMQTAINRLKNLSSGAVETLAPGLDDYLNKLEDLSNIIDRSCSYQSGEPREFDADENKRQGRKHLQG